jgi:hypothetical protein
MLRHVVGAEPDGIGRLHQLQSLLEQRAERLVPAIDVIEDPERDRGHGRLLRGRL